MQAVRPSAAAFVARIKKERKMDNENNTTEKGSAVSTGPSKNTGNSKGRAGTSSKRGSTAKKMKPNVETPAFKSSSSKKATGKPVVSGGKPQFLEQAAFKSSSSSMKPKVIMPKQKKGKSTF
jgi:hypothetical protein